MPDTFFLAELQVRSVAAEPLVVPVAPSLDEPVKKPPAPDPTRYGDWEKNGRCIDF